VDEWQGNISYNREVVQQLRIFLYVGSVITGDTEYTMQIHSRLAKDHGMGSKLSRSGSSTIMTVKIIIMGFLHP